jgi:hypothetical protein
MAALSGGPIWTAAGCFTGIVGSVLLVRSRLRERHLRVYVYLLAIVLALAALPQGYFWVIVSLLVHPRRHRTDSVRLLETAALLLALITPLYHPYARLWLPVVLLGWLITAGIITSALARHVTDHNPSEIERHLDYDPLGYWRIFVLCFVFLIVNGPGTTQWLFPRPGQSPRPLDPSDSLRKATAKVIANLPSGTPALRLLVRPPVTFYLGGRIPALVEPSLERLIQPGNPQAWALVDLAQLRQEGDLNSAREKLLEGWELVQEYPTRLNLPTLLDIDPGAASAGRSDAIDQPLWLLRPRTGGPSR